MQISETPLASSSLSLPRSTTALTTPEQNRKRGLSDDTDEVYGIGDDDEEFFRRSESPTFELRARRNAQSGPSREDGLRKSPKRRFSRDNTFSAPNSQPQRQRNASNAQSSSAATTKRSDPLSNLSLIERHILSYIYEYRSSFDIYKEDDGALVPGTYHFNQDNCL